MQGDTVAANYVFIMRLRGEWREWLPVGVPAVSTEPGLGFITAQALTIA